VPRSEKPDSTARVARPPISIDHGHVTASAAFLALALTGIVSFVTANIVAVKLVHVCGLNFPGGALVYPLAFLADDVITELYGYRCARVAIWAGFLANLFFIAFAELVLILPAAPFWHGQPAYQETLGTTPRLLLAATLSYLAGSFSNAFVMSRMKLMTKGRWLWSRTIASTCVGQAVDSVIFIGIAFSSQLTLPQLASVAVTVWAVKTTYEALLTPVVYRVTSYLKKTEGYDTYDYGVDYNPLRLL
jgi:queuosine precursor transporter